MNSFKLIEIYRVAKNHVLQTYEYGNWSREQGSNFCSVHMNEKRNNLQKFVFKGTAVEEPPLTIITGTNESVKIDGFSRDIWNLLESKLNFTTEFVAGLDNAYGSLDNGTWSGIIQMMINKDVEFAVNLFRITTERLDVVDFTIPIMRSKYQVYMKEPSRFSPMWNNFMTPLSRELWITVVTSIIVFGVFGSVIIHVRKIFMEPVEQQLTLLDAVHLVFGAYCQQGQPFTLQSTSCRVVFFCAHLVGLVLIAAYSAALISSLAKRKAVLPFNNLEELVRDGSYKLGLIYKSAEFNIFYGSGDELLNETYNKLIEPEKYSMPTTSKEGLDRTCDGRFAFFLSNNIANGLLDTIPCKVIHLPGDSFRGSESMVLSRNSPYRELFNHYLMKLKVGGVLQALQRNLWPLATSDNTSAWTSVDIHDTAPILSVLAVGILISLLILLMEITFNFCINNIHASGFAWTT
ncbi:hypothetical protein L9F63_016469 [Diploptera punctata]|uniref:Ionotropic glutamate receptor L-glutamate and glycine-binding domain-containing protein n=1 Tax=Diploptera punctata TaxID=6984 RepID=A0AAD8EHJ1_DIPPU|nr:hypothetical protein L9F63_016469 [Diploptera punctata]